MIIPYPASARSPNGDYMIEALTDVEKVENFEFPLFTYRLSRRDRVIWESSTVNDGHGPRRLYVSDQGRVVLETYGGEYAELKILSSLGKDGGTVVVTDRQGAGRMVPRRASQVVFDGLGPSSGGLPWSDNATAFFLVWQRMEYLSLLFPSGQRLLLWLEVGIPVVDPDPELVRECERVERDWARERLRTALPETLCVEFAIIIRQRLLDLSRELQHRVGIWPMGESQRCRSVPLANELRLSWGGCLLSIALLQLENPGPFTRTIAELDGIPLVDQVNFATRGESLHQGMSGLEVLQQAGSPDFAHPWIAPEHQPIHSGEQPWDERVLMLVSEYWDYYRLNGEVLRIRWEPPAVVDDRPLTGVKIRSLETLQMTPQDWEDRVAYLVNRFRGGRAACIISISAAH